MITKTELLQICDEDVAGKILAMMRRETEPCSVSPPTKRWVDQCYHTPHYDNLVLHAANFLLETCGVEHLSPSATPVHLVYYCNTGDMYARTLCLFQDRFFISSYEDIVRKVCRFT